MEKQLLPIEFAALQEFADRFAISDDVDRGVVLQAAGPDEKRRLVEAVSPRFEEINAYLDQHDDEPAHLLGRLAEAACEALIDLDRAS